MIFPNGRHTVICDDYNISGNMTFFQPVDQLPDAIVNIFQGSLNFNRVRPKMVALCVNDIEIDAVNGLYASLQC